MPSPRSNRHAVLGACSVKIKAGSGAQVTYLGENGWNQFECQRFTEHRRDDASIVLRSGGSRDARRIADIRIGVLSQSLRFH